MQWVAMVLTWPVPRQQEIIQRLSAGGSSGRATSAQKALERLESDDERVEKPFVAKRRRQVLIEAAAPAAQRSSLPCKPSVPPHAPGQRAGALLHPS